jgi:superfamily II DNA or RNA helicase
MISFRELDIPAVLNTSSHNLIDDFFNPVLSNAISYERGVGYFSSGWLRINSIGLSKFAENGGHAKWITSPILEENDWKALLAGEEAKKDFITKAMLKRSIPNIKDGLQDHTLSTLAWLVADGILEFKIALPRNILEHGEFHDKFGIFYDAFTNSISFSGSYNDSVKGTINYESIKIFKSWMPEFSELVSSEQIRFKMLWGNCDPNLQVYDLPDAAREEIMKLRSHDRPYKFNKDSLINEINIVDQPHIPSVIELRDYQVNAINAWIDNDYKGIFEMATGTGKTFTALAASIKLLKLRSKLSIITICPLQHLVIQWAREAEKFGFFPLLAFDSSKKWLNLVNERILQFNHDDINNIFIITTYDTFTSNNFQDTIKRIKDPILIIGDEVHHLGSLKRQEKLPDYAKFRLGLSATPTRWYDATGTKGIINYFGDIIFKFPLAKAIQDGFLTSYFYYPKIVELTEEEVIQYELLSKKIGVLMSMGEDLAENKKLLKLLIKRSELLQTAENKIPTIINLLENISEISHTLFYCAPGQIDELTLILGKEKHLRVHRFTYREDHYLRKKLLQNFDQGILQALLAIRCLDEGVDIPSTRTAFFLSSSSNPREFVQRRGRILRNYPGKEHAEIYDLIVAPPHTIIKNSNIERSILRRELQRFKEFAENSRNFNSAYEEIWELSQSFGIYDL